MWAEASSTFHVEGLSLRMCVPPGSCSFSAGRAWPGLRGLDGLRLHLEVETGSLKGLNDSRVQCVVTDHFNFFFFPESFPQFLYSGPTEGLVRQWLFSHFLHRYKDGHEKAQV